MRIPKKKKKKKKKKKGGWVKRYDKSTVTRVDRVVTGVTDDT
jgi:hypothetical protein